MSRSAGSRSLPDKVSALEDLRQRRRVTYPLPEIPLELSVAVSQFVLRHGPASGHVRFARADWLMAMAPRYGRRHKRHSCLRDVPADQPPEDG